MALEEYELLRAAPNAKLDIECSQCSGPMEETNPGVLLLSDPLRKNIHCPHYGHQTTCVARGIL